MAKIEVERHSHRTGKLVRIWLLAVVLPGLGAFAWEISYQLKGDDLHGVVLWIFGAYAVGVALWATLRLKVGWRAATLLAFVTVVVGYDLGFFIASAGPISLFPWPDWEESWRAQCTVALRITESSGAPTYRTTLPTQLLTQPCQ